MIRFVGFAILKIGGREFFLGMDEVVDALAPKRFEIEQMAGLFLDGPFFAASRGEAIGRDAEQEFFEASGCTAQADAEIGVEIGGKVKFEFALKPWTGVAHGESLAGFAGAHRKTRGTHTKASGQIGRVFASGF